jgi:hypothetical protein
MLENIAIFHKSQTPFALIVSSSRRLRSDLAKADDDEALLERRHCATSKSSNE